MVMLVHLVKTKNSTVDAHAGKNQYTSRGKHLIGKPVELLLERFVYLSDLIKVLLALVLVIETLLKQI